MTTIRLREHLSRFNAFTAPFLREGDENVILKHDHTMRVVENARKITDAEDIPSPMREAALLAAVYHDAGRFIQYRDYGTFRDAESANHARLSIRAIKNHGLLDGVPEPIRRLTVGAVALHNVRAIPEKTTPAIRTALSVVRDADKLDILPVILDHCDHGGDNPVVMHGATPDPDRFTPELFEQILSGRLGDYELIRWTNDFLILLAGWIYDLNHPYSCGRVLNDGLLDRIFAHLPETTEFKTLRDSVTSHAMRKRRA